MYLLLVEVSIYSSLGGTKMYSTPLYKERKNKGKEKRKKIIKEKRINIYIYI